MPYAVKLYNVSMDYMLRHNAGRSLKTRFVGLFYERYAERIECFRALNDITLTIPTGCSMGVVGMNGSGKSTLLKLVAGLLSPTSGRIELKPDARVGTMIQLGVGFCPTLTGAENIYLNASLYGFGRREIDSLYEKIVEFSELGDFIDVPINAYSSGMYARLGFAIIVHLDVDILLIDEILGVGDAPFQEKCLRKLQDFRRAGKTILFVSHSTGSVEQFCDYACILHHGRLIGVGKAVEMMRVYEDLSHSKISVTEAIACCQSASQSAASGVTPDVSDGVIRESATTQADVIPHSIEDSRK